MAETKYFKITNEKENHHGFQYKNGLNLLLGKFNENPKDSCCEGGMYFTDAKNILKFLDHGIYLREVYLPLNPDLKMIKDKTGNKWRANMIILGERYELSNVETFKMLIESGANIHDDDDYVLRWSAFNGHVKVVRFLIKSGADIHAQYDYALRLGALNGHLEVVRLLIESGATVRADNDCALRWSAKNGHVAVVRVLIESGANIHADNDFALRWCTINGYSEVVQLLIESGAKLHKL